MKDITPLILKYQKQISEQVNQGQSLFSCPENVRNYINILAEVYAYTESVIPRKLIPLTIFDLDGISREKSDSVPIRQEVALAAKEEVCGYCWGRSFSKLAPLEDDPDRDAKMMKMSKMTNRRENCRNVVIYGDSLWAVGRSFVASLIMKEAIKTRMRSGHTTQTYDWVDFGQLVKLAFSKEPEEEAALDNYCNRDWMVVDDITRMGLYPQRPTFYSTQFKCKIHDFFNTRYSSKKVTIFVFRFNHKDVMGEIEDWYGHSVISVIQDSLTCTIALS